MLSGGTKMTGGICPIARSSAWGKLGASALIFASVLSSQLALGQTIIPAVRNFAWNPGMMSKGGIPLRTTVCATLSPSGGDDSAAIQAALDSCPANQVVMLNAGTFTLNTSFVLVHSSITLRGSGAGVTILNKTNGAKPRTSTVVSGTNGILTPVDPGTYSYDAQPVVIVGPSRWPGPDSSTSQNLTADGQQGATSVTIANASGFTAGQFVLLDEMSGASWQAVPAGFGCSDNLIATPCPPEVWQGDRVAWNMHFPEQQFQDDNGNSNLTGPYDTTPGVPPAAMSWFSRTDRPTSEIKEVASVSGNTITFTSPLSIGYRMSHSAQLTRYTPTGSQSGANSVQVTNAGVENLSMYGGADGELRFESAAYSWAKDVEVTQWIGEGVAINNSFRIELRDSYLHTGSWPMPGGAGYIVSLANNSSEVLIENNILIDACKEMVFRSSGAGSVVGYNYADDSWDADNPMWVEVGLNASHMAGPHHVLFEGNYSQNFDSDYTHGNASYLTVFRNWLSGKRRDFGDTVALGYGNIRTVGLAYGSWWDSFIGNVLGRSGQMSGWNYTDPSMNCDAFGSNCSGNVANWIDPDIWKLGYDPERWNMAPDTQTLSTVIRDGNYDFLTNSQRWHNTPAGFTIPNSMYLTSTPAFFGSNPWPWVNPTTGTINTLPAKARFDGGTPNQVTNPNQNSYSVAVSASPSSAGKVAGGGTFASGGSDTVTATANSGYAFTNWTENGTVVSTAASYTFTLTANRNLVANFTVNPVNYTVAVSATPSNGGTVGGGGTFASGSSDTVTATASSGYTFTNWTENGTVVSSAASYTFTLAGNRNLVANFNTVNYTIALSASPSAGGTVSGSGTFTAGTSHTVTAAANSGYTFTNWTENGTVVSSAASYTFALTGSLNLVANFTVNPPLPNLAVSYTVAVSASPTAGGTVTGTGTFASGSSQTVTATPNSGYTFANWTANGSLVSTSASYAFALNSNVTLLANFIPVPAPKSTSLGETTVFSGEDGENGNLLLVQDATLSQKATLKSLSFHVDVPGGSLRLGIYDATGPSGGPGALKAQTASFTPVVGWNTRSVTSPVSLPPGKYWLAYFPSSNSLQFSANFSTGSYMGASLRFGPMPAKFPAVSLEGTTHWSLYGTLQ